MFKVCLLVGVAVALGFQTVKALRGAEDAKPDDFPYHVYLMENDKQFCNGALISLRHVLTAGHCVHSPKPISYPLTAVVGTNDLNKGGQVYRITGKAYPSEFPNDEPSKFWMYDIGIFTLGSDVILAVNGVGLARLPKGDPIQPNSNAIMSAAGFVKVNAPASKVLQKLTVRIMSSSDCQAKLPGEGINKNHICTFTEEGKGGYYGDSGAPLVQGGYLIGVYVGTNNQVKDSPDVFSNVNEYMNWIGKNWLPK